MYLQLFINDKTNEILSMTPSEYKFDHRIGDSLFIDDTEYIIGSITDKEFISYELIVSSIRLMKMEDSYNGLY